MKLKPLTDRDVQRLYLGGTLGGLFTTAIERHGPDLLFWLSLLILMGFLFAYSMTGGRTGEWGYARKRTGARAANVS